MWHTNTYTQTHTNGQTDRHTHTKRRDGEMEREREKDKKMLVFQLIKLTIIETNCNGANQTIKTLTMKSIFASSSSCFNPHSDEYFFSFFFFLFHFSQWWVFFCLLLLLVSYLIIGKVGKTIIIIINSIVINGKVEIIIKLHLFIITFHYLVHMNLISIIHHN